VVAGVVLGAAAAGGQVVIAQALALLLLPVLTIRLLLEVAVLEGQLEQ
jgi:hypothetical protein